MAFNILRAAVHEETERSKRGDHSMLVKLLRTEKPLPIAVRLYIAAELEKPPRRRFARQTKRDYDVEQKDRLLINLVAHAKLFIAMKTIDTAIRDDRFPLLPNHLNGFAGSDLSLVRWGHVSDRAALDHLATQGFEFHYDDLNNAINRRRRSKGDRDQGLKQQSLLTFHY